ncbi:hypothetical protein HPP92_017811 [Vanilla planifolia]|uniref:Uncharacterized protein n=1 Tax=Vanilla planifolia TaxID=51239 RepID=A0A835QGT6_VANPL|nr:hypothetical protein HPP92_017811 [Vanilla planifolia]
MYTCDLDCRFCKFQVKLRCTFVMILNLIYFCHLLIYTSHLTLFLGRQEKEYEMILRRTLLSICLLTVHPNTTTSVIVQVIGDDGALLPCAINASCAALVDAGIPLKHVAVAISCGLAPGGSIILDPTTQEEQEMEGIITLVFPNPPLSVLPKPQSPGEEHINLGVITSLACGMLSVADYERCLERGSAACIKISEFLRRGLQSLSREGSTSTT